MATRVRSPGRIYTPSPAHTHEIPTTNERLSRGVSDTYTMNSTLSPGALSQQELFDAVSSGVSDAVSRLGLLENHIGLIESIRNLPAPAVDLSHITGLLTQLLSLKDGHAEVLEAITNVTVEQPDLSPIIQAIANLRNSEDIRRGMVDAITNLGMDAPDFSPVQQTIQEMKTEMKRTFEDFRRTIQEDMHVLQQEVLKNRQETRGNSEILLVDLQAVPRELEELRNEVRKLALTEIDQSEVLNAIRQIAIPEHSPASIADAVHDRLLKARLRVDNSDILQSLQNLEVDQVGFASLVTDRIRKLTLNSDTSEVLQAIRRLPDAETISKHILDKTKKVLPDRSDFGQLLDAVKRIRREPDIMPILSALQALEIDLQPILEAIDRIKPDHSPMLELLRRIEVPDVETIGHVVTERLRKHNTATREECFEIANALRSIPGNSELLEAMRNLERALDLQSVADSVRGRFPDQISIASAVTEKIKRASLHVDNTEVLAALSGIRVAVESLGHSDLKVLLQEVCKGNVDSGQADILRALGNIQFEIRQLREAEFPSATIAPTASSPRTPTLNQYTSSRPVVHTMQSTPVLLQPQVNSGMAAMQETTRYFFNESEILGPTARGNMQQTTMPFGYSQVVPTGGSAALNANMGGATELLS